MSGFVYKTLLSSYNTRVEPTQTASYLSNGRLVAKILNIFDARQVKSVAKETRSMTPKFIEVKNILPLSVAIAIVSVWTITPVPLQK